MASSGTGEQGPTGPQGATGPQGPAGTGITAKGSIDYVGKPTFNGTETGDVWIDTNNDAWVWTEDNNWDNVGKISGPAGADGANGQDGAQGPEGPEGPVGTGIIAKGTLPNGAVGPPVGIVEPDIGDVWFDANNDAWVWTEDDGWENVGKISGPEGADGANGQDGAQGPEGPQGPVGTGIAAKGSLEYVGPPTDKDNPETGDVWIDSADDAWVWTEEGKWDNVGNISGPPGKDGATGSKGDQGDTGPQGLPGPTGPAGDNGISAGRIYGRTITSLSTIDSTNDVGQFASIAIGINGNPIISYYDETGGSLKVAACTDTACTDTPTPSTVDGPIMIAFYTSITIGADGNPIISYYDTTDKDLKVAACTNPTCTSTPTITTVDSTGSVGLFTSITIGVDNNPIISYYDNTYKALKVAACTNPTCTDTATITTVDSGSAGKYSSITIGPDGNPIIGHADTDGNLKVAACTNPTCTNTPTITTIDTDGSVASTSITIGVDGNPIISYYDATNGDLKVAACTNSDCTVTRIPSAVDSAGNVGLFASITIGPDGNPIISYFDADNGSLKVAACTNPTCTDTPTFTTVDNTGGVGWFASITIGVDGNPVISYYDNSDVDDGDLKVAKLTRTSWTPNNWES
ncbi:MAG: hypothetical protein P8O21_08775 [Ilumatobacter sp.]|nr:hypothetical protein [Ilumatobacter sp.]